jgi:hypothetical protein
MTGQRGEATWPKVDDPAFLTALVTEHFVLQTARSIGTSEATGRAGLYVATLSSGLFATSFARGKPYFAVFLGAVLIVAGRQVRSAGAGAARARSPCGHSA